jgi:uncharacterized protein (TIGR00251 family)
MTPYFWDDEKLHLRLHLKTNANNTGWLGVYDDRLKLQISATPVKGKANKLLLSFIADYFNVKKGAVTIMRGDISLQKEVIVDCKDNKDRIDQLVMNLTREQT